MPAATSGLEVRVSDDAAALARKLNEAILYIHGRIEFG
jgi:hypothetical protein